jgi:hypothetical protein
VNPLLILSTLAAVAFAQTSPASPPIARLPAVAEPQPARPWQQSISLHCGGATYRIAGYGAAYPADTPITVNRRLVRGEAAALLARDLAERGAAYRIAGLCTRGSSELQLLIYRGLARPGRPVAFHVGAAWLSRRGDVTYGGLEQSDAETFWFR